jgi:hypothetical protein
MHSVGKQCFVALVFSDRVILFVVAVSIVVQLRFRRSRDTQLVHQDERH